MRTSLSSDIRHLILHLVPLRFTFRLSFLLVLVLLLLRCHVELIRLGDALGAGADEQVVLPGRRNGTAVTLLHLRQDLTRLVNSCWCLLAWLILMKQLIRSAAVTERGGAAVTERGVEGHLHLGVRPHFLRLTRIMWWSLNQTVDSPRWDVYGMMNQWINEELKHSSADQSPNISTSRHCSILPGRLSIDPRCNLRQHGPPPNPNPTPPLLEIHSIGSKKVYLRIFCLLWRLRFRWQQSR